MLGCDWLQMTGGVLAYDTWCNILDTLSDDHELRAEYKPLGPILRYQGGFEVMPGCKIYHNGPQSRCLLIISGSGCDLIMIYGIRQLCLVLLDEQFEARVTRFDACYDDVTRIVEPADVHAVVKRGDVVNFKVFEWRSSGTVDEVGNRDGDTLYLGRRGCKNGSGRYMRIYDKAAETGGYGYGVRWEVEYSGDRATVVGKRIAGAVDDATAVRVCGQAVGGAVDFVYRDRADRVSRAPRYDWWAEIVERIGECDVEKEGRDTEVLKTAAWLERNVVGPMAMVLAALGEDWLEAFAGTIRQKQLTGVQLISVRGYFDGLPLDAFQEKRDAEQMQLDLAGGSSVMGSSEPFRVQGLSD